jgi:hypothetical protein
MEPQTHRTALAAAAVIAAAAALTASCYQSHPRRSIDGEAGDACVPPVTVAERVYPGVFVLLDRSRSMDFVEGDLEIHYWDPARDAINAVVLELEAEVAFGLGYFPDPACDALEPNCCAMEEPAVAVSRYSFSAISESLDGTSTSGGTPTAPSLLGVRGALSHYIDLEAAFVLLVTDGVPNCNADLSLDTCTCAHPTGGCGTATQCLDDRRTYEALESLRADGVLTYVVGLVGAMGDTWYDVMHAMAAAGGTEQATLVEDVEDVGPVLTELARQVTPCLFHVDPGFFEDDPDAVVFELDGVQWGRDTSHARGWDLVEEDRVRFYGEPCDAILGSDVVELTATVPCPP